MFSRRRPPRRRPLTQRPLNRRLPLQPKVKQALQRAHRLMENEEYAKAAEIFERLASGARQRGMPRRATPLFLQAGRAYILAGAIDKGAELIWQSLKMLAHERRWPALQQIGNRIVIELTEQGSTDLAQEIEQWLEETLPDQIERIPRPRVARRVQLPLKCPSCGGPVHSDDIEWEDGTTAVCPYCGNGVRAIDGSER